MIAERTYKLILNLVPILWKKKPTVNCENRCERGAAAPDGSKGQKSTRQPLLYRL
jgi:hypothetical protein